MAQLAAVGWAGVGRMTIDELARRAGTTTRNVRALQERRLLPPPERQGRVGWYGDGHLARLRLIDHLAGRGFSQAAIRELLDAWQAGHGIREVLGLEEALAALDDPDPVVLTADELAERFGGPDPGAVARAVDLGLLEPVDGGFLVTAPEVVDIGARLVALGVPLAAVLEETARLRHDVDRVAGRFVGLFVEHVVAGAGGDDLPGLAAKVTEARPLAARAVERLLARALSRHLADAVAAAADPGRSRPAAS